MIKLRIGGIVASMHDAGFRPLVSAHETKRKRVVALTLVRG